MKYLSFLFVFFFSIANNQAQQCLESYIPDANATPREHNADIIHMKLEVAFDAPKAIVFGKVTHTFKPLRKSVDTIFWDGPGIIINKVSANMGKTNVNVTHKIVPTGIITTFNPPLSWDNTYDLVFEYEANPRRGIYFIGWNSPANTDNRNQTRKQIWTQGQGIDNRHWIPMYDQGNDKFITETIITFQQDYKVLSNGELKSCKDNKNGTKTWHYLMPKPHAGYLLMLAIDKYEVKLTKTKRGTPVQFWYYPEHAEKLEWTSRHTEKMIEFLEDETGFAYPWGSYSQVMVQDFLYGAMENTSATIFGDFFNVNSRSFLDRNYIGVNCHELTHQWFGDCITARSSEGTWLQESFATYYAKLFSRMLDGEDEYKWNHKGEIASALAAGEKDNLPIIHSGSGTARVYPKGSSVIQMMRYVIGDDAFKKVIKHYLELHAFGNVESNDLNQAIQDVLGISMDWFFDQWLYRGGEPHYQVAWVDAGKKIQVNVQQIQEQNQTTGLFKMPIEIAVYYTDGTKVQKRVWIEKITEEVTFENANKKQIAFVLFDVNNEITKKLTFTRSFDELSSQLLQGPNMIDRYEALAALSDEAIDTKRKLLIQAYEKEPFWAMKADIIKQLSNDKASVDFISKQMNAKTDTKIKRALLTHTQLEEYNNFFIASLTDSSYNNAELALDKLVAKNPLNDYSKYLDPLKNEIGHNHNIITKWLEYAVTFQVYSTSDKSVNLTPQYANQLVDYTSNKYEFRTRIAAMGSAKRAGIFNETLVANLMDAASGTNGRLASPAADVLKYFAEDKTKLETLSAVFNQMTDETKKYLKNYGISY